jgi:hypothetical protein
MYSYNRGVLGKHAPSPTTSPRTKTKKVKQKNSPVPEENPTTIVQIPTNVCDAESSMLHDSVAQTTLKKKPSQLIQGTKETYNNHSEMQMFTYNDTYASDHQNVGNYHHLPIITPHEMYKLIIMQHNLSNIQCIIFLSNEGGKDSEVQLLHLQLQLMQQQMEDNKKRKKEEELAALKEKYMEAKQEARDARMGGNNGNKEKTTYICIMQ